MLDAYPAFGDCYDIWMRRDLGWDFRRDINSQTRFAGPILNQVVRDERAKLSQKGVATEVDPIVQTTRPGI
jgi:hypothetical protein